MEGAVVLARISFGRCEEGVRGEEGFRVGWWVLEDIMSFCGGLFWLQG